MTSMVTSGLAVANQVVDQGPIRECRVGRVGLEPTTDGL